MCQFDALLRPRAQFDCRRGGSSDFWALGCIIYQMIAGRFVFRGLADWQKIKQLEYSFPEGFDEQAQDLVQKLLVRTARSPDPGHSSFFP